jgi:hypothetical protein
MLLPTSEEKKKKKKITELTNILMEKGKKRKKKIIELTTEGPSIYEGGLRGKKGRKKKWWKRSVRVG